MIKKEIPGLPGYFADDQGHIWHYKKRLASVRNGTGYQKVNIKYTSYYVQRLVCLAFYGPTPECKSICIREAPRQQSKRIVNSQYLRWGNRSEIKRKKYKFLTRKDAARIRMLHSRYGKTGVELAARYGVTQPTISNIITGKTFKITAKPRGRKVNYKGVHWHKRRRKWCVERTIKGVKKRLGYFSFIGDAVKAYNQAGLTQGD